MGDLIMDKYLIEIHAHTSDVSNCADMPAKDAVKLFAENGYNGMVITDHLHSYAIRRFLKKRPNGDWDDIIDCLLEGYKIALEEAKKYPGFKVYLGCELRFDEYDNDYLVFGLSEDKLRQMKDVNKLSTLEGIKYVKSFGCTIIQAHPFRDDMAIVEPGYLDGVEVHNGHPNHDSRNDIALAWAEKFNYIKTSGSDFHGECMPNSGIYTDELPENEEELRKIIAEERFTLKLGTKKESLPQ